MNQFRRGVLSQCFTSIIVIPSDPFKARIRIWWLESVCFENDYFSHFCQSNGYLLYGPLVKSDISEKEGFAVSLCTIVFQTQTFQPTLARK